MKASKVLSISAMWLCLIGSLAVAILALAMSWETFAFVSLLFGLFSVALAVFAVVAAIMSK